MGYQSPSTQLLADMREKLQVLAIPIHFKLPTSDVLEPFIVIGSSYSDTSKTAQTGFLVEDVTAQVDIYLPGTEARGEVERVKYETMRALGHNRRQSATLLMDDSIGREVYHIAITFTETIL